MIRFSKRTFQFILVQLFEQGNSVCSFELMQSASTMSPCNVIIRPEVSSTSSDAPSHVMLLFPKRSIDLDTASLEVKLASVAIDYAYSTWNSMDSIGRKRGPL